MSRRSGRRNRHRGTQRPDYRRIAQLESQLDMASSVLPEDIREQIATKARRGPAPRQEGVTLTGSQLATIVGAAQQIPTIANPLPRPPQWAQDPFPPGTPLYPAPINRTRPDTGRAEPRLFELPLSTNINFATAPYVPWRILTEAADMPLFRKCIERRKGICDLDYAITVDPKAVAREAAAAGQHEKDVESAMREKYAADIVRVSDWLATPDAQNDQDWTGWTKALMENRLVYDATVVYPQRSYGGDLLALRVIDGSTIKPLLDEYGARPAPPYPFCQQILYGFPRGEFTATVAEGKDGKPFIPGFGADEMLYERTIYRPKTPYGMSATEIALLDGIVWMRRMGWILDEYTESSVPTTWLEMGPEVQWTVQQWEDWLRALNDKLAGNTAERLKIRLGPPGAKLNQLAEVAERYKPDYDMFLVKLIAGDFGLTATELGFPEVGSLGASFHEGEEDVLNRVTRIPDASWVSRIATKLARRHLNMPDVLMVKILGLESEDEAAADAVAQNQTGSARMTLNEDRARRGEPAYDFPEADMPMLISDRGIVFIEGASQMAPPGTLIQPASVKPGDPGDSASGAPGQQPETPPAGQKPKEDDVPAGQKPKDAGQKPAARKAAADAEAEVSAYRTWARRGGPRGTFTCNVITKASAPALAPEMTADSRVVFKDTGGDDGDPKVPARTGRAGAGILSS